MKSVYLLIFIIHISALSYSQNQIMLIKNNNKIVFQHKTDELDSVVFNNSYYTPSNTFMDIRDSNFYHTVKIGNQVWMAENLRYLPFVSGPDYSSSIYPCFYVYGYYGNVVNDAKATANYNTYGVLYNWPAAMNGGMVSNSNPSGVQGICPCGWHLPSNTEYWELIEYAGGQSTSGGKLKEAGTAHWASPNVGATNEFGFTGLPDGMKKDTSFRWINWDGYWWTTHLDSNSFHLLYDFQISRFEQNNKEYGFNIRCVRD